MPTLAIVLCVAGLAYGVAPDDEAKSIIGYRDQCGGGLNADVAKHPLTLAVLDRWNSILGTSEAQRQFLAHMYDDFAGRHNEYMDQESIRYCAMVVELAELWKTVGASSPEYADHQKRVDRESSRIRQRLVSLEYAFIESIQPVLTQEQMERVMILQSDARRRNCRIFTSRARWMNVELRDIWENISALEVAPAERNLVEESLADYELRLTQRVCERADLLFKNRQSLTRNRIDMMEGAVGPQEGKLRYFHIMRRGLKSSQQIRALHEETVAKIESVLPDNAAQSFVDAVKQQVFPEVYPDPTDLHELLNALAHDQELGQEGLEAAEILARDYAAQHQRVSAELEAFCVDWGDRAEEGVMQSPPWPEALEPLIEKRTNLSRNTLKRLDEVLGTAWHDGHAALIPGPLREAVVSEVDPVR